MIVVFLLPDLPFNTRWKLKHGPDISLVGVPTRRFSVTHGRVLPNLPPFWPDWHTSRKLTLVGTSSMFAQCEYI